MGSRIWTPGGEYEPRPERPRADEPPELTPEELAEQIRRISVAELLFSTMSTLAQLGFVKLDPASRDLEQARLAIESLRALVPVAEPALPPEASRDLKQVVTNLQLAYASAADEQRSGAGGDARG